ncbi:KfrA, partial [Xanthomonas hortorum pv. gardneri]
EAKADEIERRAGDLRAELDRAHQDADQVRAAVIEAQQATQAATARLDQVRGELATVKAKAEAEREAHQEQRKTAAQEAARQAERYTKAQAERDQAREEAGSARERAAELAGKLTAHQEQAAALLARITPTPTKKKGE